jgi:hypothetical protein
MQIPSSISREFQIARSEYAVSNDNVFALKNPGAANEVRETLTEVLREGAWTLLAHAIEAEVAGFLRGMPTNVMRPAVHAWYAMATCPSAPSRQALARYRCGAAALQFGDSTAVSAPHQDPGRAIAVAVSE